MDQVAGEELSDGRRLRAARNRDAVVEAVLEILREQGGGPVPGAAEVAERAGVSERTVFRHFADLDSLFVAAARHQRPLFVSFLAPRPDGKELDKRIADLVRLRSRLYEEISPIRRVALNFLPDHESLGRLLAEATKASRAQLADVFQPELQRAGRDRTLVLDEVDLVTSWSAWERLRKHSGMSAERSRKITSDLLGAVLRPYSSRGRR